MKRTQLPPERSATPKRGRSVAGVNGSRDFGSAAAQTTLRGVDDAAAPGRPARRSAPTPSGTGSSTVQGKVSAARIPLAKLPLDGTGALYEQVARALRHAILHGHLSPGERMPATRTLAQTLGVSRNTIATAYEILRADQLTVAYERSGTRVADMASVPTDVRRDAVTPPQSRYAARLRELRPSGLGRHREGLPYDLHYGDPPHNPALVRSWSRRLLAAARIAGPFYPDPKGFLPLRRALVEYLARRRGITCSESDVLIVGGTQQAIALSLRTLVDEGETVAIEEPYYQHLKQAITAHGARSVGISTDESGIVTSELRRHRARLICVTPSHQFPSGAVLTLERRLELLDIAASDGSWILEDDYDSEFQYRGRPLAALRSLDLSARVVYVGTFSKTLFPSLRLGFIVTPPGLREDFIKAKRLADLGSPAVEQAALASFIRSRQFEKHLRRTVLDLNQRRRILIDGLLRHGRGRLQVNDTGAGVHIVVWLRTLSYPQLDRLIELALNRGLGLYPIHPHYHSLPPRPGLLLGYAGVPAEALARAAEIFGECLDAVESARRR
jgi:GntR family transcriptional regulator/MocR family aminotransferase